MVARLTATGAGALAAHAAGCPIPCDLNVGELGHLRLSAEAVTPGLAVLVLSAYVEQAFATELLHPPTWTA